MANKLIVSAAPHITSADSTSKIMGRVCIALLPTLIASVLIFGFRPCCSPPSPWRPVWSSSTPTASWWAGT